MPHSQLDSLVRTGLLKVEEGSRTELEGLLHSARVRLADANEERTSIESRFDLAYNAAHALALAAQRCAPAALGYRPANIVSRRSRTP